MIDVIYPDFDLEFEKLKTLQRKPPFPGQLFKLPWSPSENSVRLS